MVFLPLCPLFLRRSLMLNEMFFDLPQEEEMGATFEIDSFGGRNPVTKQTRFKESTAEPLPPDTESSFDDTFRELPSVRSRRLLEAADPWQFSRGVPTNDKTSAKNYNTNSIIDGEHKTLTVLGKINEAMEDDDHDTHIYKHRLQLSDPKLSETRRAGLLEHIADHVKKKGQKLKAIQAAKEGKDQDGRPDIMRQKGYGHGVGMLSKALPAKTMSVIPQDDPQSAIRKRTAGMISSESKHKAFDEAMRRVYRRRSL
jgi:hypothetical protein